MDSTPPPPDSPVGIAHLIGSPAGRALASKVEEACRMVQPLEISDEEYAARGDWAPPIPVSIILRQVLRPAVFVLQQALDPSFHRVGYGRFEFPVSTTQMVQGSLRKLMELVVRSVSSRSGVLLFFYRRLTRFVASYLAHGPGIPFVCRSVGRRVGSPSYPG